MHKKCGIAIFMLLLIGLPIITLVYMPKEKKAFSENENRYLKEYPELSLDTVKSEAFMNDFDKWFSDRFALRERFISAKNKTENLLGKQVISTVYTKDDQMIQILSKDGDIGSVYSDTTVMQNIDVINEFSADYPDLPVYFMLCPTSGGIYEDKLPSSLKAININQEDMINECYSLLEGAESIDVLPAISKEKNEYVYYRTDHHWTPYGAYQAYAEAGEKMGFEPTDLEAYTAESKSNKFQGTLFSKTLDQSVTYDEIFQYTLPNISCTLTAYNGEGETTYDSIFFDDYLKVKDKYAFYTGQNCSKVDITTNAGTGKSILIIKDSYANTMIQFLVTNYDKITMIDMRYTNQSYLNLVDPNEYDEALFLYNCITFANDRDLYKLSIMK